MRVPPLVHVSPGGLLGHLPPRDPALLPQARVRHRRRCQVSLVVISAVIQLRERPSAKKRSRQQCLQNSKNLSQFGLHMTLLTVSQQKFAVFDSPGSHLGSQLGLTGNCILYAACEPKYIGGCNKKRLVFGQMAVPAQFLSTWIQLQGLVSCLFIFVVF